MVDLQRSRGPDGVGFYSDAFVGLGHARLSIIDLAGGAQPIHNEDQTVWVTFNGEIFNYVELRADLESAGHRFYTHTDTEVLVHLYEEHGDGFVDLLNGQFAFALWDTRRRRLLLVRDRAGILPLHYCEDGRRLLFASAIKSILEVHSQTARLDPAALDEVFTFWAPVGDRTLFAGVKQLPPGHMLVLEDGKLQQRCYWQWSFKRPGEYLQGNAHDLAAQLRERLLDATRIRLRADVPVGAYLSGGLDSTALVALMLQAGVRPDTYSLSFADPGLDESAYQLAAAQHFGVKHSSLQVNDDHVRCGLVRAVYHAESTILRCAPIPMMALSGHVRAQSCKVVLTGEGADEVLGGYDLFKEAKIRRFWARQPASVWRPRLLQRLYPYMDLTSQRAQAYSEAFFGRNLQAGAAFFAHAPRWQTTAQCKMMFADDFAQRIETNCLESLAATLPDELSQWDVFNQAQYVEAKTLMANYLLCSQGDRMLMANSVEGRFPYLDHRVIEFANALDPRLKMRVLEEKYLLKKALRDWLPPGTAERKKQPYRAPDAKAFSGVSPRWVDEVLSQRNVASAGYFDPGRVELLLRKVKAGRAVSQRDSMAFVGVLSTQVLHKLFVERCADTLAAARVE